MYILKSNDMWLGNPLTYIFNTKKECEDYYKINCIGCGIICKCTLENARNIKYNIYGNDLNILMKEYPKLKVTEGRWN